MHSRCSLEALSAQQTYSACLARPNSCHSRASEPQPVNSEPQPVDSDAEQARPCSTDRSSWACCPASADWCQDMHAGSLLIRPCSCSAGSLPRRAVSTSVYLDAQTFDAVDARPEHQLHSCMVRQQCTCRQLQGHRAGRRAQSCWPAHVRLWTRSRSGCLWTTARLSAPVCANAQMTHQLHCCMFRQECACRQLQAPGASRPAQSCWPARAWTLTRFPHKHVELSHLLHCHMTRRGVCLQVPAGPWGQHASTELLASTRADVDEIAEWVSVDYCKAAAQTLAFLPQQVSFQGTCTLHRSEAQKRWHFDAEYPTPHQQPARRMGLTHAWPGAALPTAAAPAISAQQPTSHWQQTAAACYFMHA